MVEKLGVHEFMVLTAGGTPIFHFSRTETRKLDELLSGFLSAITSFATEFGEKSIQRLSFEGSELLYEQFGTDYLFIFLVESGSSEKVLRVVRQYYENKRPRQIREAGVGIMKRAIAKAHGLNHRQVEYRLKKIRKT